MNHVKQPRPLEMLPVLASGIEAGTARLRSQQNYRPRPGRGLLGSTASARAPPGRGGPSPFLPGQRGLLPPCGVKGTGDVACWGTTVTARRRSGPHPRHSPGRHPGHPLQTLSMTAPEFYPPHRPSRWWTARSRRASIWTRARGAGRRADPGRPVQLSPGAGRRRQWVHREPGLRAGGDRPSARAGDAEVWIGLLPFPATAVGLRLDTDGGGSGRQW